MSVQYWITIKRMYLTYDLYFDVLYSGRSSILSLSFSVLIVHFAFPHYKLIGFFLNTIGICCIKKLVTKQKLKRSEIDCIVLTNISKRLASTNNYFHLCTPLFPAYYLLSTCLVQDYIYPVLTGPGCCFWKSSSHTMVKFFIINLFVNWKY